MIARGSDSISYDDIKEKYSDFEIARKYLGITRIPTIINSPLRQDKTPSLSLFEGRENHNILYKDFGTGDKGNLFELLAKLWNIPLNTVYSRIVQDIPVPEMTVKQKRYINNNKVKKISGQIEVKTRDWKIYDIEYWKTYGISLEWLKFGDIYPISHIFITKENKRFTIPAEKYAYAYVERKDNKVSLKIYQPFSGNYKWMSKHDSSVWDLWTKLPEKGEILIITSSRKDALCIWANTGIPSISLQGEGYIPKEHVMNQLKSRFNTIYVLYDNDFQNETNNGRHYGQVLAEKFNIKQIEIPETLLSKDPSDLYKNHGKEIFRQTIIHLINSH